MKLLHLSDLHLGKALLDFDLVKDQEYILGQILELIQSGSIDAVLIAGDVYDKAVPSEAATRLLDNFLSRLATMGVRVYMISGNHDSDERLNYGSSLFESNGIFISSIYDGRLDAQVLKVGDEEACIYLLPFVKASQVKHFFPDADIKTYEDAVRTVIESAQIDPAKRNILVAHQFVSGKDADPELAGSEGATAQNVGLVEKIGSGVFDRFDYVALGHIHTPQSVGSPKIRYAGSPLKYSLSEVNRNKSVPVITLEKGSEAKIDLVPLTPMRDLRHLRGPLRELLSEKNVSNTNDFIYATLTDEEIINDAMGIFRQTYPNTVRIEYDNSHTKEIERIDLSQITQNRTFDEMIGEFYKTIYGKEISDDEMAVMKAAAREAGIIDEAD